MEALIPLIKVTAKTNEVLSLTSDDEDKFKLLHDMLCESGTSYTRFWPRGALTQENSTGRLRSGWQIAGLVNF